MSVSTNPSSRRRSAAAGLITLALAALPAVGIATGASAAPGEDQPTSYQPSEASLTDVPTYETDRQAVSESGVENGQDYDHYCVANHQAVSEVTATSARNTEMVSSLSVVEAFDGNNGLLYTNQWGGPAAPFYRVVWANDFPTTNSVITFTFSDNLVPGPAGGYSADPATLIDQIDIIPGGAKFRQFDWSTYTTGLQATEPYLNTPVYEPGPYAEINMDMFSVNPNATPGVPWTPANGLEGRTVPYEDLFYPQADGYIPNVDYFAANASIDGNTITINLGDQPAGSMIVFTLQAQNTDAAQPAILTANFTADYVSTDPANTVCYPVSMTVNKSDAATGEALAGAEFTLTPVGDTALGGAVTPVTMTEVAEGTFVANTDAGLRPGEWTVSETTPPAGYSAAADSTAVLSFAAPTLEQTVTNTNEPPVIAGEDLTVTEGDVVDLLEGVTATDPEDGDITGSIEIVDDGGFDANTPGTYTIEYSVTDAGGQTVTYTRTITVTEQAVEPTQPVTEPTQPPAEPTPAPSPTADSPRKPLAATGSNAAEALGVGALLIAVGAGALAIRRKMA